MKKGDFVKCLSCPDGEFSIGKKYEVLSAPGDECPIFGGEVTEHAMVLNDDSGYLCYCLYPSCCYADWELVK